MATPKLSKRKEAEIMADLECGMSHAVIAKKRKVATGTVSNIKRGLITKDVELLRANVRAGEATRNYKDAIKEIDRLNRELGIFTLTTDYARHFKPVKIRPKSRKKGQAVAMLSITDWHLEEEVTPESVNGLNKFNLEIAHERAVRLWQSTCSVIEMCRKNSEIDTLVAMILGDMINGWIHEEYLVTNLLTPPEAFLRVFDELVIGLTFLTKESGCSQIIVPCAVGNHGRITKKKYVSKAVGTSWDWLLYNMLARWFEAKGETKIQFTLPHGDETYIDVYGKVIRVAHGDNIRYQGGIGGVHIPLRKAIDRWNTGIQADYNYFGHWHSDLTGEDYRLGGSLVGWNPFGIRIKAQYRPPSQAFELQHPQYGATARFPLILDKDMRR
ncbi:hypothetical protein LCGC14_0356060 [marine sediment metagenome]|uniref:Uncharacterized protein n=1 Tax=marine sediment metagenome TaxID=412755 RepID=A0A0F9TF34_9ZZZZ